MVPPSTIARLRKIPVARMFIFSFIARVAWPSGEIDAGGEGSPRTTTCERREGVRILNRVRVVGFNSRAGWARDVSEDVAEEVATRCGLRGEEVPANLQDFVDRHDSRDRMQMSLRLT